MSSDAAFSFESFFVGWFNTQWPNGYNKESGGKSGYTHCQATKDKIAAANGKPIAQIDPDTGNVVHIYPSSHAAKREFGMSQGHIADAARGERKHVGGYCWKYIEDMEAAGEIPAAFSVH